MACPNNWDLPNCLLGNPLGAVASSAVPAAWDSICKSFVSAAAGLMASFAKAFVNIPSVNPADSGISTAYAASLAIGALVAVLLMFGQVIRTAWTHDGSALAQGVSGVGKMVLAWLATALVATAALAASNNVTAFVIARTFKSQQAFAVRLGNIVNWAQVTPAPAQAAVGASLALIIALIGIVLLVVLWLELLLRNAALAVLLAVSPISAAGQVSETTKVWWQRLVSACIQLIILPPVIALVFAAGFAMASKSHGLEAVLSGLLTLGLAVFAWPVIARFFTFATIQATSSGLATALGFAAGRLSGGNGGGGPAGVRPDQWSQSAERNTMASRGAGADGEGAGAGAGAGTGASTGGGMTGASGGGGGGTAAGGAAAGAAAVVGAMLSALHQAGQMAAGRMEQTASHAGMHGAYPYSTVGSGQRTGGSRSRRGPQPNGPAPENTGSQDGQPSEETGQENDTVRPARRPGFRPPRFDPPPPDTPDYQAPDASPGSRDNGGNAGDGLDDGADEGPDGGGE